MIDEWDPKWFFTSHLHDTLNKPSVPVLTEEIVKKIIFDLTRFFQHLLIYLLGSRRKSNLKRAGQDLIISI